MPTIFISYRRKDNPYAAGQIYDNLVRKYGNDSVFFDIDDIPLGEDFEDHISRIIANCDVVLVVIGDKWFEYDENGRSRLDDETDYVRIEIASALQRGVPVIPLLVGNADVPKPVELPETIKGLAKRNGTPIRSGIDFPGHMQRLTNAIDAASPPAEIRITGTHEFLRNRRTMKALGLIASVAVAAWVAFLAIQQSMFITEPGNGDSSANSSKDAFLLEAANPGADGAKAASQSQTAGHISSSGRVTGSELPVHILVTHITGAVSYGHGISVSRMNECYVITAGHLLEMRERIQITTSNSEVVQGTLVGLSTDFDVALVKLEEEKGLTCGDQWRELQPYQEIHEQIERSEFVVGIRQKGEIRRMKRFFVQRLTPSYIELAPFSSSDRLLEGDVGMIMMLDKNPVGMLTTVETNDGTGLAVLRSQLQLLFANELLRP